MNDSTTTRQQISAFTRLKDAPNYCAMGKDLFAAEIRPMLTEYQWGKRGVSFRTSEIDQALNSYAKQRIKRKGQELCSQGLKNVVNIGTSKSTTTVSTSLDQLKKLKG